MRFVVLTGVLVLVALGVPCARAQTGNTDLVSLAVAAQGGEQAMRGLKQPADPRRCQALGA